jgi:hypothetical protein
MQLKGDGVDRHRPDAGEGKQVARQQALSRGRRPVAKSEVERERLERAASESGSDVEAPASGQPVGWQAGVCDREDEEVTEVDRGRVEQQIEYVALASMPREVDVSRRACAVGEAEVEREAALQQPPSWRASREPGEQPLEGDALAVAGELELPSACARF